MKENITSFLTLEDIIHGTLAWDLVKEKEAEVELLAHKKTAQNALKEGLSIDLIAKLTGLSIAEIKKIQKDMA
jgi:predicted transposase YdaD